MKQCVTCHSSSVYGFAEGQKRSVHARLFHRIYGGVALVLVATSATADPLAAPSLSSTLQPNDNPFAIDAGPLGKVYVSGQLSGIGLWQNHVVDAPDTGNSTSLSDVSNAQVEVQSTEGPLQFYIQAGSYSLPSLGTPYLKSDKTVDRLYGDVPVGYLKAVISPEFSVMAGSLPTLIGAESTFTFQNINIQRGLLWNQEPASSRGAQVNYSSGNINAALSVNDGFYSGKYNWVTGSFSYALDAANTLSVIGGGDFSSNSKSSVATPTAQNNSQIYNLIFTHTDGALVLTPYLQYTRVDEDSHAGIDRGAETYGAAFLAKYSFSTRWSIGARAEYLDSKGGDCSTDEDCSPTNLLYGADSNAWSLTATPTYQDGRFFVRGELAYVRAEDAASGSTFGDNGTRRDQVRVLAETGVLF
ncbi:putative OmpL-like beta-barrel porin-2 [Pseudomonas graminis]|uniref:porin n=1 Tax=Pseudomonas graminis TaxID=158627 RepID=UPI00105D1B41|nr:porin [Pseudomonas graminis]TDV45071.1 putative OmpL-like beta-barrel porin-2 [Pseudomonas graminis]